MRLSRVVRCDKPWERGEIGPDEWDPYRKLKAEERHNVADHERRRESVFGKMRDVMDEKRKTGQR